MEYDRNDERKVAIVQNNDYFRILGHDEDNRVVVFNKRSGIINHYTTSKLGKQAELQGIAPINFWTESVMGENLKAVLDKKEILTIKNTIAEAGLRAGKFDIAKLYGRGAFKTKSGALAFNNGKRIFYQKNADSPTLDESMDRADFREVLLGGVEIGIAEDVSRGKEYAKEMRDAIMGYRWKDASDGHIFCGWIVSSIIGGALPHRPAMCVTSKTGSGKTYILGILNDILGNMGGIFAGSSTVAGIRQSVKSDSIGVLFDEFEPKTRPFNDHMEQMRIATGGEMKVAPGSRVNKATRMILRFSPACASRDMQDITAANRSHLFLVHLGPPVADWETTRGRIETATSEKRCDIIRSYIVRALPQIMDLYDKWNKVYADDEDGSEERSRMMRAALTAGQEFLSGEAIRIPGQTADTESAG